MVGSVRGFYDYGEGHSPDATAEDSFRRLENAFPSVREQIRRDGYGSWIGHRDLLVAFAAMMAARSPLFREQALSHLPITDDTLAKNYSLTLMRSEIVRRTERWGRYHWALSHTDNPDHPFFASDQVVGLWGNAPSPSVAVERDDFWMWCPLAWDMCLVGSSRPIVGDVTRKLQNADVIEIQKLTRKQAQVFLAGPVPLLHLIDVA
jgi:alpha/beta superfamily hydrolase